MDNGTIPRISWHLHDAGARDNLPKQAPPSGLHPQSSNHTTLPIELRYLVSTIASYVLPLLIMTTPFSSLPIVDVGALKNPTLDPKDASELSNRLYNVFSTTGFAYLVNVPLSFDHDEVFSLTREFFALPLDQRMRLAKKSFRPAHRNTYRGYRSSLPAE